MYVKKDLSKFTKVLDDISSISYDLEQLWICIDKPNVGTKIIGNVYRSLVRKLQKGLKELSASVTKAQDLNTGLL